MLMRFALSAFLFFGSVVSAQATPATVIILRHGEKQDAFRLCPVGVQRSLALTTKYLGQGATDSLFAAGTAPAAFFSITLHTLELASPAAQSWNVPQILYSAVPISKSTYGDSDAVLDARTREAANDVLTNPAWNGKTVVMVWEHKHIANKKLEKAHHKTGVTLWQLLGLDRVGAPDKWEGDNYDYFWIVTYGNPNSSVPTAFTSVKQTFDAPYDAVPQNDWGKPETLPKKSGCKS